LLGEPNKDLSGKPKKTLRFGNDGSIEINLGKGWFADYEAPCTFKTPKSGFW
jgi:hypothetical protein